GEAAQELLAAGDDAGIGAAKAHRDAEALQFHGDNVGGGGRRQQAERHRLGDDRHQQRALGVGNRGGGLPVLDGAEEVGTLHRDRGGLGGDRRLEGGEVEAAV